MLRKCLRHIQQQLSESCLFCSLAEATGKRQMARCELSILFLHIGQSSVKRSDRRPRERALADGIMALRRCLCPNSWNLGYVTSCSKRDFTDVIKLKIFRRRDYLGLSGWVQLRVLRRKRQEGESQREI